MRITNIQKKELADIFHNRNLNLLDFEVSGEYAEFKIKFKHDYFSFEIIKVRAEEYAMNVLSVANTNPLNYAGKWDVVLAKFAGWVQKIKAELDTETGWENFETSNFLNEEYDNLKNKFTESEKIQIRNGIVELKIKIKNLNLPIENLKIIEEKLDNLDLKVDTLNKFDWKSQLIGTFASLLMAFIIPPEFNGIIWTYIKGAFSGLRIDS